MVYAIWCLMISHKIKLFCFLLAWEDLVKENKTTNHKRQTSHERCNCWHRLCRYEGGWRCWWSFAFSCRSCYSQLRMPFVLFLSMRTFGRSKHMIIVMLVVQVQVHFQSRSIPRRYENGDATWTPLPLSLFISVRPVVVACELDLLHRPWIIPKYGVVGLPRPRTRRTTIQSMTRRTGKHCTRDGSLHLDCPIGCHHRCSNIVEILLGRPLEIVRHEHRWDKQWDVPGKRTFV